MINFKTTSNSAIADFKNNVVKEVENILEEEIARTTQDIADEARGNAPTDLSILKNSIKGEAVGLYGEVKATAHYAPYIEFGTGGDVDVPVGLESYALEFKGDDIRTVNMVARPFLFPAFENNVKKMNDRLGKLLKDFKI